MTKLLTLWIWTGFFLRLSNALVNGFLGGSFGAGEDAHGFHMSAVEHSKDLVFDGFVTGWIYSYILGVFYFLTTDSLFLGSALSVLGWLVSAFILVRIMRILSFDMSSQWKVMFIYSFLPSSIMYTSITLREPFQLLFVNLAIYAALKIYNHRPAIHWLVLFGSVACMGALHGALLASGVFMIIGTLFILRSKNGKDTSIVKVFLITPVMIFFLYYSFLLFTSISYNMDSGLATVVQSYQETLITYGGRALYRTEIEINGLGSFILLMPYFLFQYLFEPMLWHMSSLVDVVALLENVLRFWLILNALKYLLGTLRRKPKFVASKLFWNRKFIFFIFLSFLIMESIWSLGTTNWGTSIRHHLPSLGLILLASFAYQNVTTLKCNRSNKY